MEKASSKPLAAFFIAALSLVAIWGVVRWANPQGPRRAVARPQKPGSASARAVNELLGVRASAMSTVAIERAPGLKLSAAVPLDSQPHTLDLHLHSARAANYRIKVQQPDGSYMHAPPGAVRTYRGIVRGIEGSAVAASLEKDKLRARIILPGGEEYWVEPAASHLPDAARDAHIVYRGEDVLLTGGKCDAHDVMRLPIEEGLTADATGPACGTGLCVAEVACDADVEFFQRWGSQSAVENRINAVINAVNVQYERDAAIRHVITTIIVRTAEPDPYTATDASTLLSQFRSQWLNDHGDIQRDLAQLFTGKQLDGNTIGIAWLNATCGSYGFSVVESDFTSNFACSTDLTAHELGHNWGADHCDCAGTPSYTMNPYITCSNQFHPSLTIPEVESFRDSRGCLTPAAVCQFDADCDDGLFCTGAERCNGGICETGGDPCPGEDCDDDLDACVPQICDDDGLCDDGEDCQNCPNDCLSGTGGVCGNSVCEIGAGEDCISCPQDCSGVQSGKPSRRFCCGDAGHNPVGCEDNRCSEGGKTCTESPGTPSCCGDGVCEGIEDASNCAVDCAVPCGAGAECDDGDACTIDTCDGGFCANDPIDCDDADPCTVDACYGGLCSNEGIDCDDGDSCTTDSCDSGSGCVNIFPACGPTDGCCGPACTLGTDPDCSCRTKNDSCALDGDCCSGVCKPNGRCK